MPDREKVIKGLECHQIDKDHRINCSDCPYHCDEFMNGLNELHNDALELLIEQQKEIVPYIDIDEAKCPDCKVKLTRQELLGEDVLFEDFYDYCPRCGRKVKWE